MERPNARGTLSVRSLGGRPVIEARLVPLGKRSPIPHGKVLVRRVPIPPPGATEAEIRASATTLLLDAEDDADAPAGSPCWLERLEPAVDLIGLGASASVARNRSIPRRDPANAAFV